jgi:hypothetical protein
MKDRQTINKQRQVIYASAGLVTGITDLQITIKPPSGIVPTATFVEQGNGIYLTTYTPTALGVYQETVKSITNGDNVTDAFICMSSDEGDLKLQLDTQATTLATMQTTLNQIKNLINRGGNIN